MEEIIPGDSTFKGDDTADVAGEQLPSQSIEDKEQIISASPMEELGGEVSDSTGDEAAEIQNVMSNEKSEDKKDDGTMEKYEVNQKPDHTAPSVSDVKGFSMLPALKKNSHKVHKTGTISVRKPSQSVPRVSKVMLASDTRASLKTALRSTTMVDGEETPSIKGVGSAAGIKPLASTPPVRRSLNIGSSRSNFTVPQPFALATDKRASLMGHIPDHESTRSIAMEPLRNSSSSAFSTSKKLQVSNSTECKPSVAKHLGWESAKPGLPSNAAIVKASQLKMGMNTFKFNSDARAEKRKEFNSKLEARLSAIEAERNQAQAKTKEEAEAEVKQLRKKLSFKATPMPNFYQESGPSKTEIKKTPPTRPISPKLGRRNIGMAGDSQASSTHWSGVDNQEQGSMTNGVRHKASEYTKKSAETAEFKDTVFMSKRLVGKPSTKLTTEKSASSKRLNLIENGKPKDAGLESNFIGSDADKPRSRLNESSQDCNGSGNGIIAKTTSIQFNSDAPVQCPAMTDADTDFTKYDEIPVE